MRFRQQGFTLLEIMVVIAIMGLIAVMVTMTMPSERNNNAMDQAETLKEAIRLAADRALIEGRMMGVIINTDGWQIVTLRSIEKQARSTSLLDDYFAIKASYQWQPWLYRRLPLQRHLSPSFRLMLNIQGMPVDLYSYDDKRDVELTPLIWLYPSGEITSFKITLLKKATEKQSAIEFQITGDALGNIKLIDLDKEM